MAVVSLPTPDGRISLRDLELTEVTGSDQTTREIDAESYLDVLRTTFGIALPELPSTIG